MEGLEFRDETEKEKNVSFFLSAQQRRCNEQFATTRLVVTTGW